MNMNYLHINILEMKGKNDHMNVKPLSQARDCIEKIKFAWVKMNIKLSMLDDEWIFWKGAQDPGLRITKVWSKGS